MHLNHSPAQTTTATLGPSTLDVPLDAGCSPLETIAFITADSEQTKESLKQTYLECLKDVKSKAETLRQTVVGLLDLGFSSQQLVAWAKAAGRDDRYSLKLLS